MKRIYWIILLVGMVKGGFAQNLEIRGLVQDELSKEPLEFANVVLQTSDSVFVTGTTSDTKGFFAFGKVKTADYMLIVSSLGYENQYIGLEGFQKSVDLGTISMVGTSVSLEGVTVSASNSSNRADRKIVFPSERQVKASNNGMNLLQQLMLPKLQVNPLFNTVSLPGGGELQLRINGVKVADQEIIALQPSEIIRIEYHDNPGLRYGNAEVVLNYIVRRPDTGGSVSADLTNGVNAVWGNDQLSAKVNYKKSEFSMSYNINPRDFYEMWRDNEERFQFADGAILQRKEIGEPGHLQKCWQNLNLNYSYQEPEKYLLNATIRYYYDNTSHMDYRGKLYNVNNMTDIVGVIDKSSDTYRRPALDLYYQHDIKNDQTLVFNVVGTYNNSNSARFYQESREKELLTDVNNRVDGNKYSLIAEGIYEKKLGKNSISAGLKHDQSLSDNDYRNGHSYTTHMNQAETYMYGEFRGKVEKLTYTLGAGVSRSWFQQEGEGDGYQYYTVRPKATLQYTLPGNSFVRLNGSINNTSPSLSNLSAIDQTVDSLQIQRGNPNLKPYLNYGVALTYELQKGLFYGNLWGSYEYVPNAIMEEKRIEGDKFIQTWDNQKNWQRLASRLTLRVGPVKDILQVSGTVGVNHYLSNGNTYFHRYTNWFYSVSASATYKKFLLAFEMNSNWNWFWGETMSGGENIHMVMLKYNHKNLSVGVGAFNPFSDNFKQQTENWSEHASYKRTMYINESSRLFLVQLAYSFSFGRKYTAGQKRLYNSDNESGIMSTGK